MKTYILQLEKHDDVISTRDKMMWSKANRILLVWPDQGRPLFRQVDLVILKRYSQQLGAQLAFVSTDPEVKAHASVIGIPVFQISDTAQKRPWRRLRARRKINLTQKRYTREDLENMHRVAIPRRITPALPKAARFVLFGLGVAAVLALFVFFLPGANVILAPVEQEQALTMPVWVNPDIVSANVSGGMPAGRAKVSVEGQDELPSTGQYRIGDHPSIGKVIFTNLTAQSVTVPAGTVVRTLSDPPQRFQLTQDISVPVSGDKTAEAPVESLQPGAASNVGVGQIVAIEGSIGPQLSVNNTEAVSGGSERTSPAPTEADYTLLRRNLLEKLRLTAMDELKANAEAGQMLLAPTLAVDSVLSESRTPAVGQPGDRLRLKMRVELSAWVVKQEDLQAVATAALNANLPMGAIPVSGSFVITALGEPVIDGSNARWEIKAARRYKELSSQEILTGQLLGRDPRQVSLDLNARLKLKQAPFIELQPRWWPWMPFLGFRIHVEVQ